jgi:hypothetical protein
LSGINNGGKTVTTTAKSNDQALAAFTARKAEIDRMLAKLAELSANHFNVDPDTLHWGNVGDLGYMRDRLTEICEAVGLEPEAPTAPTASK